LRAFQPIGTSVFHVSRLADRLRALFAQSIPLPISSGEIGVLRQFMLTNRNMSTIVDA
jgi:hypothetical protein